MSRTIYQRRSFEWKKQQAWTPLWSSGWSALRKLISMIQETVGIETLMNKQRCVMKLYVTWRALENWCWQLAGRRQRAGQGVTDGIACEKGRWSAYKWQKGLLIWSNNCFFTSWDNRSASQAVYVIWEAGLPRLVIQVIEEGDSRGRSGQHGTVEVRQDYWKWVFFECGGF